MSYFFYLLIVFCQLISGVFNKIIFFNALSLSKKNKFFLFYLKIKIKIIISSLKAKKI